MKESQNIEWKESWRDEYIKWICGFANANGGTLYIGKDDKGKVTGISNAKKLLKDIPNKETTQKTTRKTTQKILSILKENPSVSRKEIAVILGDITEDGVKYQLSKMKKEKILERIGPAKGGYWKIIK